jgi:hypothetical protein
VKKILGLCYETLSSSTEPYIWLTGLWGTWSLSYDSLSPVWHSTPGHRAGCHSGKSLVSYSACTPAILTEVLHVLPQSLAANTGTVLRLSHGRFLPNPFQFMYHTILRYICCPPLQRCVTRCIKEDTEISWQRGRIHSKLDRAIDEKLWVPAPDSLLDTWG